MLLTEPASNQNVLGFIELHWSNYVIQCLLYNYYEIATVKFSAQFRAMVIHFARDGYEYGD